MVDEAGVLETVIKFVTQKDYEAAHAEAIDTMSVMLFEPVAVQRVCQATADGAQAPIVHIVKFLSSEQQEVIVRALACIKAAVANDDMLRLLHGANVEEAAVNLLVPEDPKQPVNVTVAKAACEALASMAHSKSNAEAMIGFDVIPKLQRLLAQADDVLLAAAACTLQHLLSQVAGAREAFMHNGSGYNRLLELVGMDHSLARAQCLACLYRLAGDDKGQELMTSHSPIKALAQCLRPESNTTREGQAYAMSTLATLCSKQTFRKQVYDANISHMVCLTLDFEEQVTRIAATQLITACAADEVFARQLYDAGALSKLSQADASLTMPSPYIAMAKNQILTGNLAAKLALTDALAVNDRLTSLFYDAGRADQQLPSIASYLAEPVNDQRPILLASVSSVDVAGISVDKALVALIKQVKANFGDTPPLEAVQGVARLVAERCEGCCRKADVHGVASLASAHAGWAAPSDCGTLAPILANYTLQSSRRALPAMFCTLGR